MDYDLKIRGGLIVDGTGKPAVRGDLAVKAGRIVALGIDLPGRAARTVDAGGLVTAPGFIDVHTHYDAQIFWDRMVTASPWHGATTVVIGNCGFGVAPTRPADRLKVLRTLENVEGMDFSALEGGMGYDWPFETFGEFLDYINRTGMAINICTLVGHTPLRIYVMGEAAFERRATQPEIEQMRQLLREALRAGAAGFATSRSQSHIGYMGNPVPSRVADLEETYALTAVLGEMGTGTVETAKGPDLMFDQWAQIMRANGRPFTTSFNAGRWIRMDEALAKVHELQRQKLPMVPQISPMPILMDFNMDEAYPFLSAELFKPIVQARSQQEKISIYADPDFRRRFREQVAAGIVGTFNTPWKLDLSWVSYCPDEPSLEQRSLTEVARERRMDPVDLMMDLSLRDRLTTRFKVTIANDEEDEVLKMLSEPAVLLGPSDAGAHAGFMCDAGIFTYTLGHWVREKQAFTMEAAIRLMTSVPADFFGLRDRGRLAPGAVADLVVFDPRTVATGSLRRVHDLPGGAHRVVSEALGIELVAVNGTVIRERGKDTLDPQGPLPGRVARPS